MIQRLSHITILIKDYDQALKFYIEKLGFLVHKDVPLENERWLTLILPDQSNFEFILAKPTTQEELAQVGKQGGDMGIGTLTTNDCHEDYKFFKAKGVEFIGEPKDEPWGISVIFKDLYGNRFYLNQPK